MTLDTILLAIAAHECGEADVSVEELIDVAMRNALCALQQSRAEGIMGERLGNQFAKDFRKERRIALNHPEYFYPVEIEQTRKADAYWGETLATYRLSITVSGQELKDIKEAAKKDRAEVGPWFQALLKTGVERTLAR